jgi:hypothetical protein
MVYVVTMDMSNGIFAYGPFEDPAAGQIWVNRVAHWVDLTTVRMAGHTLLAPFERADPEVSAKSPGRLYQQGMDADAEAFGWIVTVVAPAASLGFGMFSSREAASEWYLRERAELAGSPGLVIPVKSPQSVGSFSDA